MYTEYWKLQSRPFDNRGSEFYYPSETHQATMLKLRYAIQNRCGGALMAGPSGIGKSLLVELLLADLSKKYAPLVHLKFPQMPPPEFLAFLAEELTGKSAKDATVDQSLHGIQRMLADNHRDDRHAVVVIDEAQLLRDTDAMETIRLLLNFAPAWTLLLVAQPALLPALQRMPELEERLGVTCLLRHFALEESVSYISHRMHAAGAADLDAIFEPASLEAVHRLSGGIPRRINRLCDLALLIGFAEEQSRITATHIEAVADELIGTGSLARRAA
jgi:general secretion pathway protein A